ncbi:MAG: acetylesterase [Erysipelotrichaceae bacterium]|nr:acetylesterase [Erysipelotrichaceae bacterium]
MSTHFVKFRSRALARNGEFYIHLPEKPENLPIFLQGNPYYQRPAKTLILLHGYSGDCDDWLYNSAAADFSMRYNLAVVMPTGGLDFYVDKKATGRQNCKFIGEDLIKYLRDTFNLAQKREDTLIGGLSMGGYGALHTGLMYPETFGGIMALSSALIIYNLKDMKPDMGDPVMANYEYYVDTFGDLKKAIRSDHNPEVLYKRNVAEGRENPRIFMACGTEDFLLAPNRRMRNFLKKQKATYTYVENPGIHDWNFWTPHAYKGIDWLLEGK